MEPVIKTVVHKFVIGDYLGVEAQTIYEAWERTDIGLWIKQNVESDLEIVLKNTEYGIDMGGGFPVASHYEVLATFTEKNYIFYTLKWAK
jgi:hypothetical protein